MSKLRKIILLLAVFCLSYQFIAAKQQERRVYYLDCSYSMVKPNKIWEEVCRNLKTAIDNVEDETTELLVIPFAVDDKHHAVLDAFSQRATSNGKEELKKKIEGIHPSKNSKTYHSDPLKDFYNNNRVASNGITYMFLMTDGQNEDSDPTIFPRLLRDWQSHYGSKNVYGFYVMLNPTARNNGVNDIIERTSHLWKVETADVNINLIRFEDSCTFNVRNDKYIDIPVAGNIEGLKFKLSVTNQYYHVEKTETKGDYVRLYITHPSHDQSRLPQNVPTTISIEANNKGKFDFLLTDKITVRCYNKKVKSIRPTFNKGKKVEKLGRVIYHPRFLWSGKELQPLTDTLHLHFSVDAMANGGYAVFQFVDNDGKPIKGLHVCRHGEELKDNVFRVQSDEENVVLTFQYDTSAKAGKYQGWLRLIDHNLDQDGDTELTPVQQNNSVHWQIRYEKNMNPLAKSLMWIGFAILGSLIIWLAFLRQIKYPRFRAYQKTVFANQQGQVVYNKKCQFKGARMVVFADKKEKQSLLNRLFAGRIDTYVNPAFTQKIVFTPKKNGKYAFVKAMGYAIMPNPIPRDGTATIRNNQIEINIK